MPDLRVWTIARCIVDKNNGRAKIAEVAKIARLKESYTIRLCKKSPLFQGVGKNYLYYISADKLCKRHGIRKKTRNDLMTEKFIGQFKSKQLFNAYIAKCYVERDTHKKLKKITKGQISYQMLADGLGVSRTTAITLIKNSTAKVIKNTLEYRHITFKTRGEFSNWLLNNMGTKVGNYRVEGNPRSYRLKFNGTNYHLIQELPNIYKFTGLPR